MKRAMVTVRQMKIFKAVVDHGSFRACADAVGISQVVVSSHIRELERNLGAMLFDRRAGHAASLTTKGQHSYERISSILADIQDLHDEVGEQSHRLINLTTFSYLFRKFQKRITDFQKERPSVDLRMHLDPPDNAVIASQISNGTIDVACFFTCTDDPPPDSLLIGEDHFGVYVTADHPLANAKDVTPDALSDFSSVSLPTSRPLRKVTDQSLAAASIVSHRVSLETDAFPLILEEVRGSTAWVCLFRNTIDLSLGLVEVDLKVPPAPLKIHLLYRPSARLDPNIRALRDTFTSK